MAYKDEYEVARLHRDPGFAKRIAQGFGPGAKVNYHMAPPLWPTGTDARGRPNKRRFSGALMGPAFAILARMKGLRGTMLDPFGHHPERRMERELIIWFEGLLARAATEAGRDLPRWRAILAAPMGIRGYGPVKAEAANVVRAEVATKLG
jgi:indolepyruvate ferredoxin oxidoreductase